MSHPVNSVEFQADAVIAFLVGQFNVIGGNVFASNKLFQHFESVFPKNLSPVIKKVEEFLEPFRIGFNPPHLATEIPNELFSKMLDKEFGFLYWFPRSRFDRHQLKWAPDYIRQLETYAEKIFIKDDLATRVQGEIFQVDPDLNRSAISNLAEKSSDLNEAAKKIDEAEKTGNSWGNSWGRSAAQKDASPGETVNIPASDRIVRSDDNQENIQKLEIDIDELLQDIINGRTNDIDEDTQTAIIKIKAGRALISGPVIDVNLVNSTLIAGLQQFSVWIEEVAATTEDVVMGLAREVWDNKIAIALSLWQIITS